MFLLIFFYYMLYTKILYRYAYLYVVLLYAHEVFLILYGNLLYKMGHYFLDRR